MVYRRLLSLGGLRRAFNTWDARASHRLLAPSREQQSYVWTSQRRWHSGHHSAGEGESVFKLGFAADVVLTAGKALTGYVSGSTAITADAAHSLSDVVLSSVAWWSFRKAKAPKDQEHPYGHGKFETLATLGISSILLVTAGGIAWHALGVLHGLLISAPDINSAISTQVHEVKQGHHGMDLEYPLLALGMTVFSISVKEGLYWITKRAGEKEGSGLMKANAWHHRADAVSSLVALVGVGGAVLGIHFLDPLAGFIVSGMILKAGLETGYHSVMELVDAAVPPFILDPIKRTVFQAEGVKGCHRMRGRKAGSSLFLDVHIEVDPFLSVSAAHDIGENVRHQIHKFHNGVAEVFIHIDPSYSDCPAYVPKCNIKSTKSESTSIPSVQKHVESVVSDILSSRYYEKMTLEHITHHSLQGKILLQVLVSMQPDMLIRDAMDVAKEAEEEILKAASSINQVTVQLKLAPCAIPPVL